MMWFWMWFWIWCGAGAVLFVMAALLSGKDWEELSMAQRTALTLVAGPLMWVLGALASLWKGLGRLP